MEPCDPSLSFQTLGFWRSKIYDPRSAASLTYEQIVDLLRSTYQTVSDDTWNLLYEWSRLPPAARLYKAFMIVLKILYERPHMLSTLSNVSASDVFSRVLLPEEFDALVDISRVPLIRPSQRRAAEALLCLEDRAAFAHFLQRSFAACDEKAYIHPMEDIDVL